MDNTKFQERIINTVKKSLKLQNLHTKIQPIELVDQRDRYFLLNCRNGTPNKKRMLFLRQDKWFFYIQGMNKLPPDLERREYKDVNRTVLNTKEVKRQRQEESIKTDKKIENMFDREIKRIREK